MKARFVLAMLAAAALGFASPGIACGGQSDFRQRGASCSAGDSQECQRLGAANALGLCKKLTGRSRPCA